MSNLLDLYRTQISVLRDWRGGPAALIKRLIIVLVVSVVAFLVTAWLVPSIVMLRPIGAVQIVVVMAVLNAIVRPVLLAVVAPRSLVWTGVLVLVFQVAVFFIAANVAPDVQANSARGRALRLVPVRDRERRAHVDLRRGHVRLVLRPARPAAAREAGRAAQRQARARDRPDGRPRAPDPRRAGCGPGSVNTIARWIRDGSHTLSKWEAMLPSMTSASQAGILHGNNDGIPAFRWYERDTQRLMVSSNPANAAEIVRRVSNGEGLLSNNGVSICNLVTGDATRSYLTTAALAEGSRGLGESKAFMGFFFSPTGYLRSFTLFLGEFAKERYQARRTRRSGLVPQMHRGFKYAGMRAASNVLLRDVNVSLIIDEMYSGANVIYADFTDYDELAHHCGPERVESFEALDGIDRALAALEKAAANAPRPYRFVVLSDHGQSLGATFKQRYGKSLGEVVLDLMGGRATVIQSATTAEGGAFVNSFLSEVTRAKGIGPADGAGGTRRAHDGGRHGPRRGGRRAAAGRRVGDRGRRLGQPRPDLVHRERPPAHARGARGEASRAWSRRSPPTRAWRCCWSRPATAGRSSSGHNGVVNLDDGEVEGEDPMTPFGPNTLASLRREDEMEHAPDLLLISEYNPALGEVAAFEELIGSHGGLGGPQTEPFILHPSDWTLDEEVPLGAPAVYRNLRRWLSDLGIELGKQPRGAGRDRRPARSPRSRHPRRPDASAGRRLRGRGSSRRPAPPRPAGRASRRPRPGPRRRPTCRA